MCAAPLVREGGRAAPRRPVGSHRYALYAPLPLRLCLFSKVLGLEGSPRGALRVDAAALLGLAGDTLHLPAGARTHRPHVLEARTSATAAGRVQIPPGGGGGFKRCRGAIAPHRRGLLGSEGREDL